VRHTQDPKQLAGSAAGIVTNIRGQLVDLILDVPNFAAVTVWFPKPMLHNLRVGERVAIGMVRVNPR
jgi:hypothetical protein